MDESELDADIADVNSKLAAIKDAAIGFGLNQTAVDAGIADIQAKLEAILPELMSLKPRGIREHLGLNRPIYARTAAYGHFGRAPDADGGFSWEKTDKLAPELARAF